MSNCLKQFRKNQYKKEQNIINNKIKNYTTYVLKSNQLTKPIYKQYNVIDNDYINNQTYNFLSKCDTSKINKYKENICDSIKNKFRNCYNNIYKNKKEIKTYKIFDDFAKILLNINNENIDLFLSYSKKYGIYFNAKIKYPRIDYQLNTELNKYLDIDNSIDAETIKYLETKYGYSDFLQQIIELKNINYSDKKEILRLQEYVKHLENSMHYIGLSTTENISCGRREFMA